MADVIKPAKHGRDHCPGGEDPIPCLTSTVPFFRAYQYNFGQTVTNGNNIQLGFDRWQTSDDTVIESAGWIAGTPDYVNEVQTYVRALWAITLDVEFTTTPTTGSITAILEDAGSTFGSAPKKTMPMEPIYYGGDTTAWSFTWVLSYPPIWNDDTGGGNASDGDSPDLPQFVFMLLNNTGASRTTSGPHTRVEIHCLYQFDYGSEAGNIQAQA